MPTGVFTLLKQLQMGKITMHLILFVSFQGYNLSKLSDHLLYWKNEYKLMVAVVSLEEPLWGCQLQSGTWGWGCALHRARGGGEQVGAPPPNKSCATRHSCSCPAAALDPGIPALLEAQEAPYPPQAWKCLLLFPGLSALPVLTPISEQSCGQARVLSPPGQVCALRAVLTCQPLAASPTSGLW